MKVCISERAEKELDDMEHQLRRLFIKHMVKLQNMPPRRHLKFGLPFDVENVTKNARMVYEIDAEDLFVVRCFSDHKEYERWYKSFKL